MKLLLCGHCKDIRALDTAETTTCRRRRLPFARSAGCRGGRQVGLAGHNVPTTVTVTEVVRQFAELPRLDVELWDDPR